VSVRELHVTVLHPGRIAFWRDVGVRRENIHVAGATPTKITLSIDDLNSFGRSRLESDFLNVDRRDGGKTSRTDFALGWMALAVRFHLWSLFTDEAKARLQ
jgi:hypothetical protein